MFSSYSQGAPKLATGQPEPRAAAGGDLVKDTTTQGFRQDVLAESMKQPVLVDFWAPGAAPASS